MKNNIFLFNGEERFLLMQELKKRKDAFASKYGKENIFEFKSDELEAGDIMNAIFGGGLFVSRKLIILRGVPKDTNALNKVLESKYKQLEEKFLNGMDNVPDDVIVVFVSLTPDKRLKLYKYFLENIEKNNIKTFDKLKDADIKRFISKAGENMIKDEAIETLLQFVGNDLFALNNEISKLKAYAQNKGCDITKDMVERFVFKRSNIDAFGVLDKMLFEPSKTIDMINENQKSGQDEFEFLGLLYWGIKISLQMIDLAKKGIKDSKIIASKLGIHPFVVAKNIKIIDKLMSKENKLKEMFGRIINLDFSIKTGKLPAEIFWLEIKNVVLK